MTKKLSLTYNNILEGKRYFLGNEHWCTDSIFLNENKTNDTIKL